MPQAFASRKCMGLHGLAGQETQGHRSPAENGSGKPNRQGCNSRRIRQGPIDATPGGCRADRNTRLQLVVTRKGGETSPPIGGRGAYG